MYVLLLSLLPLCLGSVLLGSRCGSFSVAMWNTVPFNPHQTYSLNTSNTSSTSPNLLLGTVDFSGENSPWTFARLVAILDKNVSTCNCSGILVQDVSLIPGYLCQYDWQVLRKYPIPIALVGYNDYLTLLQKSCSSNFTFQKIDQLDNPWKKIVESGGYAALYSFGTIIFFVNMLLAIRRIFKIKWEVNLGVLSLACEILANFLYFLRYLTTVLLGHAPTFNYSLVALSSALITVPVPFFFTSSLLFIFFWLDITSTSSYMYSGKLLSVMKVPSICILTFIFTLQLITDVVRFTLKNHLSTGILSGTGMFYGVELLALAGLNGYSLVKVWRNTMAPDSAVSKKALKKKVFVRVIVTVVVLCVIAGAAFGLAIGYRNLVSVYVCNGLVIFFGGMHSLNQIMVFGKTKIKSKSTRTVSKSHTKSKSRSQSLTT